MNEEFDELDDENKRIVRRLVKAAKTEGGIHTEDLPGGGDAYAYRRSDDSIAWGRNSGTDGFCTHRGVFTS
jgi:hypothetical protein